MPFFRFRDRYWQTVQLPGMYFPVQFKRFNLKTPGREDDDGETKLYSKADYLARKEGDKGENDEVQGNEEEKSAVIVRGLGGRDNISDVDCCATRLRCTVKDRNLIDEGMLKQTGTLQIDFSYHFAAFPFCLK